MVRVIGWQFPVQVTGDVGGGGPATLSVEWRLDPPPEDTVVDQVRCVVAWWVRLAGEGGLGGELIAPADTRGALVDEEPERAPNAMRWSLSALKIDPHALTILFNLLQQSGLPVSRVVIQCGGRELDVNITPHDYPGRYKALPFSCDDSRSDRNVQLEVEFRADLVDPAKSSVVELVQVWSLVGALGGFREVVPTDKPSEIIPEDDVHVEMELLALNLRDRNVNEVAYDVLVNVLALASTKSAAIAHVELH